MVEQNEDSLEIAIIGMAGRFPGAINIDEFWSNLKNGVESICFFSDEEIIEDGIDLGLLDNPYLVKAVGSLEKAGHFDSAFFDYTPKEAEIMDPQIRIFHECVWTALEDAGYNPETYSGLIGLFAGATPNSYWEAIVHLSGKSVEIGRLAAKHLTQKDHLGLRISYKLNLKGPSLTLSSTCSTSLAAVHLACQSILNGECDMALAGGITVTLSQRYYLYQEGMILSPDGHCRAFDSRAGGIISGNGAGVVLLKRFEDAIQDKDNIYALIKGSALNNDGKRKAGFTAPSIEGQAEVIKMAWDAADVNSESIGYIETHGSGTHLGDSVEIEALKLAFKTEKKRFCALGSVKTNVGHLDSAAGITGLIKTTLALKNRLIPPCIHFETSNKTIDFYNSPFYVNNKPKEWLSDDHPLRAGVSSFGIGGTNAHIILEEVPKDLYKNSQNVKNNDDFKSNYFHFILLSARTQTALDQITKNMISYFKNNPNIHLANAAYTLQVGRKNFNYRRMTAGSTMTEIIDHLYNPGSRRLHTNIVKDEKRPIIFMFPGMGSQYVNMGLDLYLKETVFRQQIDCCFEILKPILGYDVKELLYPNLSYKSGNFTLDRHIDSPNDRFNQLEAIQAIVFSFEYALAKLLINWGVKPYAMIGYSFGEYTTACLAEVFSLEDALKLIVSRGKLVSKIHHSAMLSVPLSVMKLKPLLNDDLSLAINNGFSCIIAGSIEAIQRFEKKAKGQNLICIRLEFSYAFHSHMMEPILKEFEEALIKFDLKEPKIPYISNVTGNWINRHEVISPQYWVSHLRDTVQFAKGIKELTGIPNAIFVEIGPGRDLTAMLSRHLDKESGQTVINLIRPHEKQICDNYYFQEKIARLWLHGVAINRFGFYPREKMQRVSLPTYPYEGKHYWIDDKDLQLNTTLISKKGDGANKKRKELADFFYTPQWSRSELLRINNLRLLEQCPLLVFSNNTHLAKQLLKEMELKGLDITVVQEGKNFQMLNQREFYMNPREIDTYEILIEKLKHLGRYPGNVIHLWCLTNNQGATLEEKSFEEIQYMGYHSLVYLTKALANHNAGTNIRIQMITNQLYAVTGEEDLLPEKITALGPLKVIPQEYPFIICRSLDIVLPEPRSQMEKKLISQLLNELATKSGDTIVAYRRNYRWILEYKPIQLKKIYFDNTQLKKGGVYIITGGFGNFGLILTRYLMSNWKARVVLIDCSFPLRDQWKTWLDNHPEEDIVSSKIRLVMEMEKNGGEIIAHRTDIANKKEMERIILQTEKRFSNINGVIHAAGKITGKSIKCSLKHVGLEEFRIQTRPKFKGLMVLNDILKDKKLDFCLLTSSLSTILGGLGFTAYSAANLLMEASAYKLNRENDIKWMIVNWEGWYIDEKKKQHQSPIGVEKSNWNLAPEEVTDAIQRILYYCQSDQIIVTPSDINKRINKWIKMDFLRDHVNIEKKDSLYMDSRPILSSEYMAPRNHLENQVVDIWENLFGYSGLGIKDDFFELGGDSLKAITLISKIQKKLNTIITIRDFFNNPTIEGVTKNLDPLKENCSSITSNITQSEKMEYYKISSAQRGFYFMQQMDLNNLTFNMAERYIVKGKMDKKKLAKTFKKLIKRHDSLRTKFLMFEGEPVQRIVDFKDINFEIEIFKDIEVELDELCQKFLKPFDLEIAPLFRVGLHDIEKDKCAILVDMHHVISDGISHEILVEEFFRYYNEEQLPIVRIQYKDYSIWQKKRFEAGEFAKHEEYWLNQFEIQPPRLQLPKDYPGMVKMGVQTKFVDFYFDENETLKLNTLVKKEEVTLFILFIAIYNVLFFKLGGMEDIVILTITTGRNHADLSNIIGAFVNTLPLRNFPSGKKSFREFLIEVKDNTLKAFEYQDYRIENLKEKLGFGQLGSNDTLFEAGFTMQNFRTGFQKSMEMRGIEISRSGLINSEREFPLAINMEAIYNQNKVNFRLFYQPTLFKEETINRYCKYFKRITSSIAKEPEKKIKEIDILSNDEQENLKIEIKRLQANIIADFDL